jgi:hypothetical protein
MKNIFVAALSFIAVGLGSLPDGAPPESGGMLFISIFDHEPKVETKVRPDGIYLFSVEF